VGLVSLALPVQLVAEMECSDEIQTSSERRLS
jgi:hypothetical protein